MGGQARLIKRIPGHNMPQTFLDHLEAMTKKSGVKINLGFNLDDGNLVEFVEARGNGRKDQSHAHG